MHLRHRLRKGVGVWCVGLFLFFFLFPVYPGAAAYQQRRIGEAVFVYPERLSPAAETLARVYPELLKELSRSLNWGYDRIPTIVLADERDQFEEWAGTTLFSAFAVADRDLIVLDHSRMSDAAALHAILKHELCHLLLGRHIGRDRLPRWLNEGVAQWSSDGLSELLVRQDTISLPAALSADRLFDLSRLSDRFPSSRQGLALAYSQSRSVVDYLVREYGREGLLALLNGLKAGMALDAAARSALGRSMAQVEADWRDSLGRDPAWLLFLAQHLYELLFVAAALSTIYGFIRLRLRQKRYAEALDDEDDDA